MRIPIEGLDLVITTALTGLFVLPTLYHLASDLRDRPGRSFSLIPHKGRHVASSIVRFGLVAGAGVLTTSIGDVTASLGIWLGLAVALLAINAIGVTERRLTINAETGLVKWTKISLPWWPSGDRNTGFVDQVRKVSSDSSNDKMNLLGVGTLERYITSSYNGNVSSSGHYSKRTLAWVAQEVNDYLAAFKRHDNAAARATRDRFREQVQAARAPQRRRAEKRAKRVHRSAEEAASQKKSKRVARKKRKEEARLRRIAEKFSR